MIYLGQLIFGAFKWLADQVGKLINNASGTMAFLWASFITFVVVPVTWLIDVATQTVQLVIQLTLWMADQLTKLHFEDFAAKWQMLGVYIAQANVVFPLNFLFFCVAILVSLKLVALLVRIVIRLIPTAG